MNASINQSMFVVGICGPSGCGKSTLVHRLSCWPGQRIAIVSQDFYYRDLSRLTREEREAVNFDHPDAIEFGLMLDHLRDLRSNRRVLAPTYDFCEHTRSGTQIIQPGDMIIVEGTLVLSVEAVRSALDASFYIDVPLDICLLRRIQRDISERRRNIENISKQYLRDVRPMLEQFVLPSKTFADYVINGTEHSDQMAHDVMKLLDVRRTSSGQ